MIRRRLAIGAILAAMLTGLALAQMPGMEPPKSPNRSAAKTSQAVREAATQTESDIKLSQLGPLHRFWKRYMGADSPYRSLILVILTLLVLVNLKAYLTRAMRRKLKEQAFQEENATNFLKVWNGLWKFVIAILVLMAMSGSLKLLGLTAGFFGMMLGWSLQQPVTGIVPV